MRVMYNLEICPTTNEILVYDMSAILSWVGEGPEFDVPEGDTLTDDDWRYWQQLLNEVPDPPRVGQFKTLAYAVKHLRITRLIDDTNGGWIGITWRDR